MDFTKLLFSFLLTGLLVACSQPQAYDSLYKVKQGPYDVLVYDDIVLTDPVHPRDVRFRVMVPAAEEGKLPVIVHSHGGFCPDTYDAFTAHWASQGYIVIAPYHPDSPNNAEKPDMSIIVQRRVRDLSFAVDTLDDIVAATEFKGEADRQSIAVTGHSFGAGMALMKTGLFMLDEYKAPWSPGLDERFSAAVYLSAPGGEVGVENAFADLRVPFMATGGSLDKGRLEPGDMTLADFRSQVFLKAPPGDKYLVILDKADHYLGGLICNAERGGDPDPDGIEIFRAMTTAFLDAYLKDDAAAQAFLRNADVAALTAGRADYRQE